MSDQKVRFPDQRSTYDQLLSVYELANEHGHYDAADAIMEQLIKPTQPKDHAAKDCWLAGNAGHINCTPPDIDYSTGKVICG